MKHTTRKLLSLLMALVMALSLMPVALADNNCTVKNNEWESDDDKHWNKCETQNCDIRHNESDHTWTDEGSPTQAATCNQAGSQPQKCSVCQKTGSRAIAKLSHVWVNDDSRQVTPSTCTVKGTQPQKCSNTDCNETQDAELELAAHEYEYLSTGEKTATQHTLKCKNCTATKKENHTSTTTKCTVCDYTPAATATFTVSDNGDSKTVELGKSVTLKVTPKVMVGSEDRTSDYEFTYAWVDSAKNVMGGDDDKASYVYTPTSNDMGKNKISCDVYANPKTSSTAVIPEPEPGKITVDFEVTVIQGVDFDVDGYVNNDTGEYYLGDILDKKGSSIIEQIDAYLAKYESKYYDSYDAKFEVDDSVDGKGSLYPTKKYDLDDAGSAVYFSLSKALTSTELASTAESTFYFTATVTPNSKYIGSYTVGITIIVDDTASASSGDISYVAAIGDDVYFDAADFEDFYYDKTNGGTLKSVTFDTVSGGVLYCDDGKLSGKTCYVDPTTKQAGLDEVYFTPTGATAKNAKTVKIDFTAAGSKSSKTGTVSITYLNGEAKDITYSLKADGAVSLDASDFTAAYKEVTKKTAPTGMTIVFQNAPAYGELTYTDSSKSKPKDVALTSRNIKSYSFTTRASGSNQLGDVTYSGSSGRSDTIDYIAYSSGTALFTGKVVFNGKKEVPANLSVPFTCFGSAGTYFNAASFNAANTSAMSSAAYIRFGVPAHGSLTYGGVTATGVNIYVAALGSVLYQPNAGFNGTDTVIFAAYDASGNNVGSGQVNIVVSGNTAATTTNPGGSTGATSVDQFTDVPKTSGTAWYRDKLANLVSKGIMNGKGDGKFDPTGKVKNGEALKMVLLAAGYPAQATPAGNDWAINYKNLAVSNNLIGSGVVLTDDISRDAVAELAARALGLTPVTSGESPFVDSSNGYAIALYNAGIINGDTSSGSRKFLGGDTLQRAEICVIIYAMNEYVANRYASVKPDGI